MHRDNLLFLSYLRLVTTFYTYPEQTPDRRPLFTDAEKTMFNREAMRKRTKSPRKPLSGETTKQTDSRKENTPLQLVFAFLTAPVK
jgi:hypothetical protein